MPRACEPTGGHLQRLLDYALNTRWSVARTVDGRLVFLKKGLPPIYLGAVCQGENKKTERWHLTVAASPRDARTTSHG